MTFLSISAIVTTDMALASPELSAPNTNHGYMLYKMVGGRFIEGATKIADIGAGNSDFAHVAEGKDGKQVDRFDAQYDIHPPEGERAYTADVRDLQGVEDETYDTTISMLMMQHLRHGTGDVVSAIKEMVRITKTTEDATDPTHGTVLIYPVWRKKEIEKTIKERFSDVASIGYEDYEGLETAEARGEYCKPALLIKKTPSLTPERLEALAQIVEETKALQDKPTLRSMARKASILMGAHTTRYVDAH